MKSKFWIPAIVAAATFSTGAFAHGWDRDGWRESRHHEHYREMRLPAPPIPVFVRPRAHLPPPPPVMYREPVVYRAAPAYYERPAYYPRGYYAPAAYPVYDADRAAATTIGAVVGGVVGSQVGHGDFGPTALGAVIGGVIGNNIAR